MIFIHLIDSSVLNLMVLRGASASVTFCFVHGSVRLIVYSLTLYFECPGARDSAAWIGRSDRVDTGVLSLHVTDLQRAQTVILLQTDNLSKYNSSSSNNNNNN